MDRPELNEIKDSKVFRSYYYLLAELKAYCKYNGLPASGSKQEISDRISQFIDTGEILRPAAKRAQTSRTAEITPADVIEPNITCSEIHRRFFKEAIGKQFTFPVAFQDWLKQNAGKTYQEAIEAYYDIIASAKNKQTVISKQFEYNTYIRDFFADNSDKTLADAIHCWKYKKSLPGHNQYENKDLVSLEN